ncbi:MAG: SAM-dependent methyltransferase [Gammaproteobacteria bacterium]|nr:SAM-dependent methyltransferase [Gammaproteobacteria bacterium]|tara:strand:+ start:27467 stop:28135 length:669 start_codon:yes stop_codon:yes gene_type:complete
MRTKDVQLNSPDLRKYLETVGFKRDQVLVELRKKTQLMGDASIMQIGESQGKLLEMICRLGNFKKCIEIGVFTGYSSICIAKGIDSKGKLYAIDTSEEYTSIAREYWRKSNLDTKIELILKEGLDVLNEFIEKNMKGSFDFIFIDADKSNYINYYEKSIELIRSGGIIAIDNTIWKGKVLNEDDKSQSTMVIRELNKLISTDNRVDQCMLTMYDGMTLCQKL